MAAAFRLVRRRGELTAGDRQPAHRRQQRALESVADLSSTRATDDLELLDAIALEERLRVELVRQGAQIVPGVRPRRTAR